MRKVLLIFSELTDGDVDWLSKSGERIHVDAGATLVPLGARVENIWFVLDGALSVHTAAGTQLALMGSGEIVGEMSLVDPAPTAVSVRVASDATLLKISDAAVRAKLADDPAFAARFYRALCVFLASRLRSTTRRMGYGTDIEDENAKDELTDDLLDNVHLAGARFDRMLKRLAG
ncbi:MAG: cyclic nucleotide-binding domain-containing protein [Betaproteobacteria bacterium]|nr:cyclic nucleotide-binding domain-containing protein [Betaproteobacteria bacterium]